MRSQSQSSTSSRVPLNRDSVLEAARRHVAESGLESLSSRALAADLGVTPMALYRHVRDMDDVLGAVVDDALAALGIPDSAEPWRDWLEHLAQSLRQLFQDQPSALGLFTRQPVTSPAARQRLTSAVAVLTAAGFPRDDAERAYAAVHTYTIGFCALESGRRDAPLEVSSLDAVTDPASVTIHGFVTEDQFVLGLRALVSGLAAGADRS